jgi:hypothetical protein
MIASDVEMPSNNNRELTVDELSAVAGGTIVAVNGGGNTPNACCLDQPSAMGTRWGTAFSAWRSL